MLQSNYVLVMHLFFFFSSRRRHTRLQGDWSSDVCSSDLDPVVHGEVADHGVLPGRLAPGGAAGILLRQHLRREVTAQVGDGSAQPARGGARPPPDRKSTRLNSSHLVISYAVFCLKKKKHI